MIPGQHVYGFTDFGAGHVHHISGDGRVQYNNVAYGEFGHGATVHMMKHADLKKVYAQTAGWVTAPGNEQILRWKVGVPTCATYHIVNGHESCPFTGATFIHYGDDYRPLERAEVWTIIIT